MTRDEALRVLHEHNEELREKYAVQSLSLFGSVARDEAHPDSDVDLLVEFTRPVGLFGLAAVQEYLETLFGCKVDIGTPHSLRPELRERVFQEIIQVF